VLCNLASSAHLADLNSKEVLKSAEHSHSSTGWEDDNAPNSPASGAGWLRLRCQSDAPYSPHATTSATPIKFVRQLGGCAEMYDPSIYSEESRFVPCDSLGSVSCAHTAPEPQLHVGSLPLAAYSTPSSSVVPIEPPRLREEVVLANFKNGCREAEGPVSLPQGHLRIGEMCDGAGAGWEENHARCDRGNVSAQPHAHASHALALAHAQHAHAHAHVHVLSDDCWPRPMVVPVPPDAPVSMPLFSLPIHGGPAPTRWMSSGLTAAVPTSCQKFSQRLYTPPVMPVGWSMGSVSTKGTPGRSFICPLADPIRRCLLSQVRTDPGPLLRCMCTGMSYVSPPHAVLPSRRGCPGLGCCQLDVPCGAETYEMHVNDETQSLRDIPREEVDLMYDPMLNCYYDPKTNKYYELK